MGGTRPSAIDVTDTGPGIEAGMRPFEPFAGELLDVPQSMVEAASA